MHLLEHLAALWGAFALLAAGVRMARAAQRRRARRRGVVGGRLFLPCPIDWCVGHHDTERYAPSYQRGHAQPCWNGDEDPKKIERL